MGEKKDPERRDFVGNLLQVGDMVVTGMASRYAGSISMGYITALNPNTVKIVLSGSGRSVSRHYQSIVKAYVTPT